MNTRIEITKELDGNTIKIVSDCQTVQELQDVMSACENYVPRKKIFGIF